MKNSLNEQTPATKNQITNNKPSITKNSNVLQGYFANSINGGMIKPIAYKPIMAGEKVIEHRLRANIKMLTPKTPAYQSLKATFKAFFVPNIRVWKNAEKFTAQKGGAGTIKIKEVPNMGGKKMPQYPITNGEQSINVMLTDTDIFRDNVNSAYIGRYQTGYATAGGFVTMPKYSILPLRGFRAIYNDFLRNKEYDSPLEEYDSDTVSNSEWTTYFGGNFINVATFQILRGRRNNSYYTDYRTEILGEQIDEPNANTESGLVDVTEWEKKVSELRSEAENAQLNDWDIIRKIRGAKPIKDGKVRLLGKKTVTLNYQAITQTTYNTNESISEEFQAMGQQGAYSYTEVDIPLYQMEEFNEEGYVHIVMQVSADSVFETGFERTGLNVAALDQYRPDLKDLKYDVLYNIEKEGTNLSQESDLTAITGFKRKFSEYFKAPNSIAGDMTTRRITLTKKSEPGNNIIIEENQPQFETQSTFQFFEEGDTENGSPYFLKNIWQDYTDLLINKNQAVLNDIEIIKQTSNKAPLVRIKGQNQIFFIGIQNIITDMPIDENIKNNFTKWGEM